MCEPAGCSDVEFGDVDSEKASQVGFEFSTASDFSTASESQNQPGISDTTINSTEPDHDKGQNSRRSSTDQSSSTATSKPAPTAAPNSRPHKAHDAGWEAIRAAAGGGHGQVGLGHFRFLRKLGSGDIGSVYLAELRGAGCYFAVKVMDKRALAGRNKLSRAYTEKEILEVLDHPFLPTLYAHMDDDQFSCLVMEFCPGGDLHVLRQRQPMKRFNDRAVRFYAAEVLLSLEYLHMMGIVYRDLKPENVLVREDGHIMLSDFDLSMKCNVNPTLSRVVANDDVSGAGGGASPSPCAATCAGASAAASCIMPLGCASPCNMHPVASCLPMPRMLHFSGASKRRAKARHSGTNSSNGINQLPELHAEPTSARSMSFVGTHEYLAPEIILGEGHGSAVDWWTFGIFMFELLYGRTPFKGPDNEVTLMNVVTQLLRFPSGDEFVHSPPCAAAQDLIRSLLVKDPSKRLAALRGASEIKQHAFFQGVNWALIRCAIPPEIPSPFTPPPDDVSSAHIDMIDRCISDCSTAEELAKAWFLEDSKSADCNNPDYELF